MAHNLLLHRLRGLMLALNLALVLYYSLARMVTTHRICQTFAAYSFLTAAGQVPSPPGRMVAVSMLLYLPLAVLVLDKERLARGQQRRRIALCLAEMLLCTAEVVSLHFYYRVLILMVLADLVYTVQSQRFRLGIIAVLAVLYAAADYEVASSLFPRVPFRLYLSYYEEGVRGWLIGAESIMLSLHILLFIVFMVLLFTGQKRETARIRQLHEQLNESYRQLQDYAEKTEHLAELRERNRLAREIHDTLGHTLTGIIMTTDASLVLMDTAPQEAKKQMRLANEVARDGLNDVRRSIRALRPDTPETRDLAEALESMLERFCLTSSAQVNYRQRAGELHFASDEENTIYRVIQESLTNAVRHGKASRIDVTLERQDGILVIDVRDNGIGLQPEAEEGFGLRHIRERIDMLHGTLRFGSRPEGEPGGFYLTATLPLRAQAAAQIRDEEGEQE